MIKFSLRISREEYEAAIIKSEKEKQTTVGTTIVDLETGEAIAAVEDETTLKTMTFTLEISGTYQALMTMNTFIKN